jgi:hypothetical protein
MQKDDLTGKCFGKQRGDTNRKLRRNLRRMADRKGISYKEAILKFYKVSSYDQLDKNLVYSLNKK